MTTFYKTRRKDKYFVMTSGLLKWLSQKAKFEESSETINKLHFCYFLLKCTNMRKILQVDINDTAKYAIFTIDLKDGNKVRVKMDLRYIPTVPIELVKGEVIKIVFK